MGRERSQNGAEMLGVTQVVPPVGDALLRQRELNASATDQRIGQYNSLDGKR